MSVRIYPCGSEGYAMPHRAVRCERFPAEAALPRNGIRRWLSRCTASVAAVAALALAPAAGATSIVVFRTDAAVTLGADSKAVATGVISPAPRCKVLNCGPFFGAINGFTGNEWFDIPAILARACRGAFSLDRAAENFMWLMAAEGPLGLQGADAGPELPGVVRNDRLLGITLIGVEYGVPSFVQVDVLRDARGDMRARLLGG